MARESVREHEGEIMRIFTSLKPSVGRVREIQARARDNWCRVFEESKIVELDGPVDFREVAECADVEGNGLCAWINADILFEDFPKDLSAILSECFPDGFLVIGRRMDDLPDGRRVMHKPSGMDYFLFKSGMFRELPKTVMGRSYCDSALVAYCLRRNILVIDATAVIKAVHQWHDYSHVSGGRDEVFKGEEAMGNLSANRLRDFAPHIADATHRMIVRQGLLLLVKNRRSILRRLEWWGFYRHGWTWWPNFNKLWNIIHRGGK